MSRKKKIFAVNAITALLSLILGILLNDFYFFVVAFVSLEITYWKSLIFSYFKDGDPDSFSIFIIFLTISTIMTQLDLPWGKALLDVILVIYVLLAVVLIYIATNQAANMLEEEGEEEYKYFKTIQNIYKKIHDIFEKIKVNLKNISKVISSNCSNHFKKIVKSL